MNLKGENVRMFLTNLRGLSWILNGADVRRRSLGGRNALDLNVLWIVSIARATAVCRSALS